MDAENCIRLTIASVSSFSLSQRETSTYEYVWLMLSDFRRDFVDSSAVVNMRDVVLVFEPIDHTSNQSFCPVWCGVDCHESKGALTLRSFCHDAVGPRSGLFGLGCGGRCAVVTNQQSMSTMISCPTSLRPIITIPIVSKTRKIRNLLTTICCLRNHHGANHMYHFSSASDLAPSDVAS